LSFTSCSFPISDVAVVASWFAGSSTYSVLGALDWYEAWADLGGELLRQVSMRRMASGVALHRACHRATRQAFLEACLFRHSLAARRNKADQIYHGRNAH
jgi:hypothetical protein